jgi:glycosyltransferase involved in cell wall biosynthesis
MKILHIFSSKVFAGLERHVEELAFEQSKENSVLVIGPVKFKEQFRVNYKAINMNQWRWSPFFNCELRKAIVQYAPDVVHTHGYKSTALIANKQNDFIHIATIHGTKKKIKAFENADYVFGASKKSIENVKSIKKSVLENWVDESRLEKFKKGVSDRYVFVGRLDPVKNPMRLVGAWKNIPHQLEIYGQGMLENEIKNFIKDNNLSDRIKLMGSEPDLNKVLKNAKAILIPSDREGSPKILFEALYCEIPVFSTSVGIMPDLLSSDCLCAPDNASFQYMLEYKLKDIDLIHQNNVDLYELVKSKFTLKQQCAEVMRVYQALLSKAS